MRIPLTVFGGRHRARRHRPQFLCEIKVKQPVPRVPTLLLPQFQGKSDGALCSVDPVNNQYMSLVTEKTPDPIDIMMHDEPREVDMDLLSRIHGLYRLLDLISEQGSGGTGTMIAPSMPQGY